MTLFDRIAKLVSERSDVTVSAIEPATNLVSDLGMAEIDLLVLTFNVEDEFCIEVPDELIDSLKTVQSYMDYVSSKAYS